ncbi:MAG: integrase, partial [Akkermansiaceae bacterium]
QLTETKNNQPQNQNHPPQKKLLATFTEKYLRGHTVIRLRKFNSSKSGPLFPSMAEKTSSTHSTNFNNLMARAKVPKKIKLDNGDIGHRSFHSLRHSFATWLLRANVGKDVRKSLMAHSSDDVHEIYASHDETTLRSAIEELPDLGTSLRP